jgi:hypothetical protein
MRAVIKGEIHFFPLSGHTPKYIGIIPFKEKRRPDGVKHNGAAA